MLLQSNILIRKWLHIWLDKIQQANYRYPVYTASNVASLLVNSQVA